MGVPKFYRWVSERYPCLSETVKEFQIPEFDNLYLDMNGIIHVCSHPEDDNPHFRITEEKIFADIMHYLEFLFRMIKPRKVFFMAVDGVAPRAKMNQQRGRRFRSAREAEELERKAKEKGETLPSEKRFDSNCITPGTPFMVRLQEQLKYFVVKKLGTDPLWHGVRVYLSGHETPGEGEHKIMDFIRAERSRPGYDPNTRHCLNGLDADLMMLGLASHEPHFSLLREEVRFGGRRDRGKRPATPEETTFHLLHLSLFREYLDFEFSALKDKVMTFEYNLENIIDDWVLMGFLVGNDFIPHLPNLHINHDALPLLWQTYIDVLPSCGGYLNEGGHLNLERFEKYLAKLSEFDMTTFSEQAGDLKWLEGKKAASGAEQQEMLAAARKFKKNMKKMENQFAALNNLSDDLEDFMGAGTELIDTSPEDISEEFPMSDEDSEDTLDDEFRHHKRHYYMSKLEYDKVTPEVLNDQAECYVRGIQWILLYYYQGVPSWSWFYPHHYAPYMSDVKDFKNMVMEFDLASPFLPFEQLMAVLPAASREFLPKAFQSLMTMDNSPVIDFYPLDFETDLNGKQQDWEAVVLIPFIDENRLLSAMRLAENQMTEEEKSRNRHGPHCLYEYSPEPGPVYKSIIPEVFPDIVLNHSRLTLVPKNAFWIPPSQLKQGILEGAKLDVFFPGFPTLKHIQHTSRLSKEGVKVFQQSSRGYNVMLHISEQEEPEIDNVAKEYLGKEIYVGWPHLYEARVVAVCDAETSYTLVEATPMKGAKSSQQAIKPQQIKREACDENVASTWCREASSIKERYKDRLGVVIGDTYVLLKALPMTGRKYIFGSHGRVTMEKQFGNRPVPFALQTTVKDIAVHDPDFCQFKTLKEYLPESSSVFMLGWPHYGCQGEVIEVDTESGRVRINLMIFEEPNLDRIMNNQQMHDERYFPGYRVAQMLGVSSSFIGRLTGTVFVMAGEEEVAREQQNPHKVNVGLNLKFTKRGEEIPGYTKNVEGQWMYSQKTIDTFKDYMANFPEMFEIISKLCEGRRNDNYYESEVIPKHCDYNLKSVQEYIKGLHCSGIKPMKSGTDIISEGVIKAMETETNRVVEINKKRQKRVKMQVKPHLLFRHLSTSAALIPDSTTRYTLFDRIVNIRHGYAVPFGLRGTVVGIHPAEVEVNTMYEVIFDEDFRGGIAIRGSSNRGYRMPPSAVLNLTHGERKNGVKPPLTAQTENQASNFQGNQHRNMGGHPGSQNNRGGYQNFSQGRGGYSREADSNQVWERNQSEWDRQNRNPGNENRYRPPHQRDGNSRVAERQNESSDIKKPQQQIRDGYSRMVRQQNDGSGGNNTSQPRVEPKEDVLGKVFNGASAGSSHPKFVTPKVPENLPTARRQSQGESQSGGPPGNQEVSTNSEFENIWKQLQSSLPPSLPTGGNSEVSQGTSLSQAASVLPRVPSSQSEEPGGTVFNVKHVSDIEDQDGSSIIKKILNIDSQSDVSEKTEPPPVEGNKNYGRQLSIQELFEGVKAQQENQSIGIKQENQATGVKVPQQEQKSLETLTSQSQHQQQKKGKGHQKQKQLVLQGQQQQQMPRQQGYTTSLMQQQAYQAQNQKRPTLLIPASQGGNRNPVMELMTFCQSLQMGLPMYDYIPKNGVHYCVVSLITGARFQGSLCKTKEEAAESAASVALLQLKGSMQQMANQTMMGMPGFVPGVLPQGRQFSSPNSAFSPVNTFTGNYQGQGARGHHQGYNQRSFNRGQGHQQYNQGGYRQQNYQTSQSNSYHQQQLPTNPNQGRGQGQNSQNVNQNSLNKKDDFLTNQKQSKAGLPNQSEVKTQPTCVVTPFVPLQVVKKQTPQKTRKESVSEETPVKPETTPVRGDHCAGAVGKTDNVINSSRNEASLKESAVSTLCAENKNSELSRTSKVEFKVEETHKTVDKDSSKSSAGVTQNKSDTKMPSAGSAKKPKRRLAANFNFSS